MLADCLASMVGIAGWIQLADVNVSTVNPHRHGSAGIRSVMPDIHDFPSTTFHFALEGACLTSYIVGSEWVL
jgi:hypothetical protein